MLIPRLRNVFFLKNTLALSLLSSSTSSNFAPFHSSTAVYDKWKNKGNTGARKAQDSSKNQVRYAIRQKRADAKRALNDLVFKFGGSSSNFQGQDPIRKRSDGSGKKGQAYSARRPGKSHQKPKRKFRRGNYHEDEEDYESPVFEANFGGKWYTWSFSPWEKSSQSSSSGFRWRTHYDQKSSTNKQQETSDADSNYNNETSSVGLCSDRKILGLPLSGPLKINDVKKAFHLSALKWHPDKHQGPSQEMAEEKFKLCANAYQSLCTALST